MATAIFKIAALAVAALALAPALLIAIALLPLFDLRVLETRP